MLFHPSAAISDQFEAAATILEVACGMDRRQADSTSKAETAGCHCRIEQMISHR